jgi:hypothetical protein
MLAILRWRRHLAASSPQGPAVTDVTASALADALRDYCRLGSEDPMDRLD